MSERLFRAVRDFVLVRLPLYLRVFAIFLIFASPIVLVALYFARSIISTKRCITSRPLHCSRSRRPYFTDLGGIYTSTKTPGGRTQICWSYPGILGSSSESQSCCCLSAEFFFQGLYEQAALQETARARSGRKAPAHDAK